METVGIQPDGTLWISEKPASNKWTPGKLQQFGSETNWRQLAQGRRSVVLLKTDGTLWRWGSGHQRIASMAGAAHFHPASNRHQFRLAGTFYLGPAILPDERTAACGIWA